MGILFSDGFETGNYTGWLSTSVVGVGSALTANAASAYVGSFGSDALVTGASGNEATCKSASSTPSTNILSGQFRFKVHQNNVGGGEVYLMQLHNAASSVGTNFENNAGTWSIVFTNRAGSQIRTSLTKQTFTIDQWYLVEMLSDWSGANQIYQVYIDGVLDTTVTDSSVGSNRVYVKMLDGIYTANGLAGNFETYTDECKMADGYIGLPSGETHMSPAMMCGDMAMAR